MSVLSMSGAPNAIITEPHGNHRPGAHDEHIVPGVNLPGTEAVNRKLSGSARAPS